MITKELTPIEISVAGEKMLVGVVNSVVIVEVECRELMPVLREREAGLREARLVAAVVAEFEARAVELGVNLVDKMEKSLVFKADIDVCLLRYLDKRGDSVNTYLRDGGIIVAR